jgi:hypothetical protein
MGGMAEHFHLGLRSGVVSYGVDIMTVQYWNFPVDLTMPVTGKCRTITAAVYACEYLVTLWPKDKYSPSYFTAAAMCLKAMHNDVPQSIAREAFIVAARDADLIAA